MKRLAFGLVVSACLITGNLVARASEKDAAAIVDKAIAAMGGEEKLAKVKAASWKAKGTLTFQDNETEFTTQVMMGGLDRYRSEFESEFNGNPFKAVTVLSGEKVWRKFGDQVRELEQSEVKNEQYNVRLQLLPISLHMLKGKDYKLETAGEEKIADKEAMVVKVTAPGGRTFKICFDKQSSLPVKIVADIVGFRGDEFTQETYYTAYKEFDGIKRPSKYESRRDGNKFIEFEVIEFKVLDKLPDSTFEAPK